MKVSARWFVLGCLVLHSPAIQAQVNPNTAPTTLNDAIPFQLGSGFLILVEGRIGPLTPLKFILDTGATHTVVDRRIADKLSLPRQKGKVLNFDRYAKVQWTNLPELQLGPLHARYVHVMVSDLKQFSEFGEGVDAIIGLDLLRTSQSLRIDYGKSLVAFKTSDAYVGGNSQNATALIVRLRVQGQPVCLIVDTGLEGMLLYTDRLRRHVPQLKLTDIITEAHQGRLVGENAKLAGIRFGTDDLQASVLLIPGAPVFLPAEIDGYLGTSLLHAQMIELDFASNTIRWQKLVNAEATAPKPSANSYTVLGATPEQETLVRAQIRVMQPDVYPLRVLFEPHWKYIDTARIFRLDVPAGYTSAMFTHLPSRSVFIDSDRYVSDDSLGYWVAHELGHLAANSASESDADKAAREYRKRLKDARKPGAH